MSKSKGFFSKAMDIFSEEVEEVQEVVEVKEPKKVKEVTPTQTMSISANDDGIPASYRRTSISNTPTVAKAKFSEEFYNHFQTVIEANDLDGADYFEFRKTYEVLKATPSMSEIGALQATFAVLKGTSPELTVETLLSTADHYLNVVEKENEDFHGQLEDKLDVEVGGRNGEIAKEQVLQQDKADLIAQLQAEIAESAEREITLKNEVVLEQGKIDEVSSNWDFTINLVKSNIETDKGNIEQYLVTK